MTVYQRAKRHTWFMLGNVLVAFLFIALVDQFFGHSTIAFAIAIFALIFLNVRILTFTCPRCSSNLFFRGMWALPWPNSTCSQCKLDLKDGEPPEG